MGDETAKKLYYSISEVAEITGIKAHVLRYWESEFPTLRPHKGRSGSRRYRQSDIDEIVAIKELLYEQGFKIAGARRMRREEHRRAAEAAKPATQLSLTFTDLETGEQLAVLKKELTEILALVRSLGPPEAADAALGGTSKKRPARSRKTRKAEA